MKIFVCSSKHNYHLLSETINQLEKQGHIITPPNSYENPMKEEEFRNLSSEEHKKFVGEMIRLSFKKIENNDAILVMNLEKHEQPNYVGGGIFLEIIKAFDLNKKIFLYNPIPNCKLRDEIKGMNPIIINQDLSKII